MLMQAAGRRIALLGAALLAASCARSQPSAPPTAPPTATQTPPAPAPAVETAPGPDDLGARVAGPATDVAVGNAGVTSAEAHATAAGIAILAAGGNAVDAAVAVGFALGVTHPTAGNIGGGGFMVIRTAEGKTTTIDFREAAPAKAKRDMYLDASGNVTSESRLGPRAAGIAGDVAGFAYAHQHYGSLPWKQLVMPAVALAAEGFELDSFHAEDLQWGAEAVAKFLAELRASASPRPALLEAVQETLELLQHEDGSSYEAGQVWKQPALAATLETIANGGANAFYRGPLAKRMAKRVQAMGGVWTRADLAKYRAIERRPLEFDYHGHRITTMPPPSAGGVTLRQIFAASDILNLAAMKWESADRLHLYIEALRRVFADRNFAIADPDYVELPLETLLDVSYLQDRMKDIDPAHATPSSAIAAGVEVIETPQTTHYSVVDERGMAVAVTFTLNGGFGAKVQIPGTGVTLNNEMDDFTAKVGAPNMFGLVQGPQNAIAPGKRMVSSMTPTIVSKDGKLRAVCGSPGGPTIITTVAQVLLQLIDHQRPLEDAIAATRVHHQWLPDRVLHEEDLDPELAAALVARGHELASWGRIGHANCIEIDGSGTVRAVADVGRDGGDADALSSPVGGAR